MRKGFDEYMLINEEQRLSLIHCIATISERRLESLISDTYSDKVAMDGELATVEAEAIAIKYLSQCGAKCRLGFDSRDSESFQSITARVVHDCIHAYYDNVSLNDLIIDELEEYVKLRRILEFLMNHLPAAETCEDCGE
jgi:hypothetical protein